MEETIDSVEEKVDEMGDTVDEVKLLTADVVDEGEELESSLKEVKETIVTVEARIYNLDVRRRNGVIPANGLTQPLQKMVRYIFRVENRPRFNLLCIGRRAWSTSGCRSQAKRS